MQTATKNPYEVKNVKSFQGMEGYGFECSLYKDGKRIGIVTDVCDGGGMIQCSLNDGEEQALEAYCKSIPKEQWKEDDPLTKEQFERLYPDGFSTDSHSFMSKMVDKFENNKRMKTLCRNKIVYIKKDDPEGLWSIKAKYTPELAKKLRAREGDALLEIVNERFV